MKNQCEAITRLSTYSAPHRCLKSSALKTPGGSRLCAHHRSMRARKRS